MDQVPVSHSVPSCAKSAKLLVGGTGLRLKERLFPALGTASKVSQFPLGKVQSPAGGSKSFGVQVNVEC